MTYKKQDLAWWVESEFCFESWRISHDVKTVAGIAMNGIRKQVKGQEFVNRPLQDWHGQECAQS